jgi:hypothetical protein
MRRGRAGEPIGWKAAMWTASVIFVPLGTPRPGFVDVDGRSPDLRVIALPDLPGQSGQWLFPEELTAHSCGGSHGFAP